ncbi:hypothetical protein [Mycobacterium sp. 236(2023)]|uniref:hypothetical protein n=1 Tax=Mycobacterium sp. 236(2023) TaxID=3038163 RepID=UPI002415587A|nr:hypothetical protein [Mycobacterium sp. 236(2023)]MDG4668637.1 hypothetical protein [Mycobacterium sp. 236(2023)]
MIKARVIAMIFVAAAVLSACSDGQPSPGESVEDVPALSSDDCVDATGANSRPEEIVDSQISIRLPSAYTGEMLTQDEEYKLLLPTSSPPSEDRDFEITTIFDDVPSSGDAAFAAEVCKLKIGWASAIPRLSSVDVTDADAAAAVAGTPHYLRGVGRMWCKEMKGSTSRLSSAPLDFDEMRENLSEMRRDPEAWKLKLINQYESGMFGELDIPDAEDKKKFDEYQAARLEKVRQRDASDLVDAHEAYVKFLKAANIYLCPQYG